MKENEAQSYVDRLISLGETITLIRPVEINTDNIKYPHGRIKIGWTGVSASSKDEFVLTHDELKKLFKSGLLGTGAKNYNGYICPLTYLGGTYVLEEGAVVCGSLAPSSKATLRKEIYEYLCAKGYITNYILDGIKMLSGRKKLFYFTSDDTFDVLFLWEPKIVRLNENILIEFTKFFWKDYTININPNSGFTFSFLSEKEVFSEEQIQLFRKYDLLLDLFSKGIDPKIILYSVSKRYFLDIDLSFTERFLSGTGETLNFSIKQTSIKFRNGYKKLLCGKLYHESDLNCSYRYVLSVPYSEKIRGLILITRKILMVRFPKLATIFSPEEGSLYVSFKEPGPERDTSIEDEILSLDMAIYLVNKEKNIHPQDLYEWIISFMESISDSNLKEEYKNYTMSLKRIITVEYFSWQRATDYSF